MKPGMKAGSIAAVIVIATMCSARAIETHYSCADGTGIIAVFSPPINRPATFSYLLTGRLISYVCHNCAPPMVDATRRVPRSSGLKATMRPWHVAAILPSARAGELSEFFFVSSS